MDSPKFFEEVNETISSLGYALERCGAADVVVEELGRLDAIYSSAPESIRFKVISELVHLGYPGSFDLLVAALERDDSELVRHEAAFGLGVIGSPHGIPALARALEDDESGFVRHEAAISLGDLGAKDAVPALERALKDTEEIVASSALFALQEIRLLTERRLT